MKRVLSDSEGQTWNQGYNFFSQVVVCVTNESQSNCKSSFLVSGWELLWVCWWLDAQSVHGSSQLNRECFFLITSLDCISPEYFCCVRWKPPATGHVFSFFKKRILKISQSIDSYKFSHCINEEVLYISCCFQHILFSSYHNTHTQHLRYSYSWTM